MWEPLIPKEVSDWMDGRAWGIHHKVWHFARRWDVNSEMNQYVKEHGGHRENRQEGMSGNGLDFLAMHRNMIRHLQVYFPRYDGLWHGWNAVPTDPDNPPDPTDFMPRNPFHRPFRSKMLEAIDILTNHLDKFASDDDLGLFIETQNRPTPDDPYRRSTDACTGIHNYLHQRFSLPINGCNVDQRASMGDFLGNIKNQRFWRLHGWIDEIWTRFRHLKGYSEQDTVYQAALHEQHVPIDEMPHMCEREISNSVDPVFIRDLFGNERSSK